MNTPKDRDKEERGVIKSVVCCGGRVGEGVLKNRICRVLRLYSLKVTSVGRPLHSFEYAATSTLSDKLNV